MRLLAFSEFKKNNLMSRGIYILFLLLMTTALSFGQKNDTIISIDCNRDGIFDSLKLEAISKDSKFELKISNDSAWSLYYCDKDNFHYKPEAIFDIPNHLLKPNNIGCKKIIQDYIFKEFSQNNTNEIDWYFQYEKNKKRLTKIQTNK